MAEDAKRSKGLGRGLSALLGDVPAADAAPSQKGGGAIEVPIEQLQPNRFQPRRVFDEDDIEQLSSSIRELGILQPILVRGAADGADGYEIVAGERRWRAAQRARIHQVPIVVKELDDTQSLEIAIVENVQRSDLSAMEEAEGYQRLIDEFGHTQEQLAAIIGKSRSHIANTLRLLGLPAKVRAMIDDGSISAGHGRALLSSGQPLKLARKIVKRGLNVRQVEKLVKKESEPPASRKSAPHGKDADTLAFEEDISKTLGLKVEIDDHGAAGGVLRVNYQTLEQLDEVGRRLCRPSNE